VNKAESIKLYPDDETAINAPGRFNNEATAP
jgi:hypothetical protein